MTDIFDAMYPRRPPMTADEARENIRAMRAETSKCAMRRMLKLATTPIANLSEEASEIYAAELRAMTA